MFFPNFSQDGKLFRRWKTRKTFGKAGFPGLGKVSGKFSVASWKFPGKLGFLALVVNSYC
jgi:hypothetical protein